MRVLIVDNFDSFSDNLAALLDCAGFAADVWRADDPRLAGDALDALWADPRPVVLSPGPGGPSESGPTLAISQRYRGEFPLLGICLGMQAMAMAAGWRIAPTGKPVHGKANAITHAHSSLLEVLPSPFAAARYHSLAILDEQAETPRAAGWRVCAWTEFGGARVPMAITHETWPAWGLQFHPESFLTPDGATIAARFRELCADPTMRQLARPGVDC
jgi:anthranilate synthase/aminodeoxychorismate synthase-like glutamine amidotransferase